MAKRLVVKMEMTIELQDDNGSNGNHEASNARCVLCGWSRAYKSPQSAKRGLAAHLPLCPKKDDAVVKANEIINDWFKTLTTGE